MANSPFMLRKIAHRLLRPALKNGKAQFWPTLVRLESRRPKSSSVSAEEFNVMTAGQPTTWTHPHILKDGHIVPGVHMYEFRQRRVSLMEEIWANQPAPQAHLVMIPSANPQFISEKIPYPFRQSSDMMYLTGCLEQGSALVLHSQTKGKHRELLFVRGRDRAKELWDGPRFGATDLTARYFGVDEVLPASELPLYLENFARDKGAEGCTLWYEKSDSPSPAASVKGTVDGFIFKNGLTVKIQSTKPFLHNLRVIKSASEIELMRIACRIGGEAIAETISHENTINQQGSTFIAESQIATRVDYACRRRGAHQLGYPPVVATGTRTNTIHYVANNNIGLPGDLALMDAGCEYFGYNSDITRTWPLSGHFSGPQVALYEAVLDVQTELIKLLVEKPTLNQLFSEMCRRLGNNLKELSFLPSTATPKELAAGAHAFCPHHVSHFLGMDIHDTSSISHNMPLQPGMIITVEPGVYVKSDNRAAPEEFRGIGIRIEDDVLITECGYEVLSSPCPKSVSDIERLMCRSECE